MCITFIIFFPFKIIGFSNTNPTHISQVVFTDTVQPYKELRNRAFADRLFERQFKIGFCSEEIKQAYELLLENRCKICDKIPPFRTFTMLSDHMRKVHERYFCDLCVKHLRVRKT